MFTERELQILEFYDVSCDSYLNKGYKLMSIRGKRMLCDDTKISECESPEVHNVSSGYVQWVIDGKRFMPMGRSTPVLPCGYYH